MTQWEQIKKEYRDVPVPAEGQQRVLQAMAEAKRKRNRIKKLTGYSTIAAAAVLAVVLLPGIASGGFGKAMNDCASMEADCVTESTQGAGWFYGTNDKSTGATSEEFLPLPEVSMEAVVWADAREEISKEILRQMEERMQTANETYYIKSKVYPEGFEMLEVEQVHYYTEDGLLVIVFEAGAVAPAEQGTVEFVIPAEVFSPIE